MLKKVGKQIHKLLMETAIKKLESDSYNVVTEAKIGKVRLDILGIKNNKKVGVECQVRVFPKVVKAKYNKYKKYLDELIFCVPSYTTISPELNKFNFWKIDIGLEKFSVASVIGLDDKTWKKFIEYCKAKNKEVGETLSEVLDNFLKGIK